MKLEDIRFSSNTKVYTKAEGHREDPRNTLVVTGDTLWYVRFNGEELVIDAHHPYYSGVSAKRWKECHIKTLDELIFRVQTIQLLGGT